MRVRCAAAPIPVVQHLPNSALLLLVPAQSCPVLSSPVHFSPRRPPASPHQLSGAAPHLPSSDPALPVSLSARPSACLPACLPVCPSILARLRRCAVRVSVRLAVYFDLLQGKVPQQPAHARHSSLFLLIFLPQHTPDRTLSQSRLATPHSPTDTRFAHGRVCLTVWPVSIVHLAACPRLHAPARCSNRSPPCLMLKVLYQCVADTEIAPTIVSLHVSNTTIALPPRPDNCTASS